MLFIILVICLLPEIQIEKVTARVLQLAVNL